MSRSKKKSSKVEIAADRFDLVIFDFDGGPAPKARASLGRQASNLVNRLRRQGFRVAAVAGEGAARTALDEGGLVNDFDAVIDGVPSTATGARAGTADLRKAARRIGIAPARVAVIATSAAGVAAGARAGLPLVVGVAADGATSDLYRAGADAVVADLSTISVRGLPSALESFESVAAMIGARRPAVFLDFDGTLTPIVNRPELAVLDDRTREVLARLAERLPVAVVSGRDLADIEARVGLAGIVYSGSHGFQIKGPNGLAYDHPEVAGFLAELDAAEAALRERLRDVAGALVERKRYSIAAHCRLVRAPAREAFARAVQSVHRDHPRLARRQGKKVNEFLPDLDWDKGKAVVWCLAALRLSTEQVAPIYIGDDVTDETAFRALRESGVGIVVANKPRTSQARFRLTDPSAVIRFLESLIEGADGKAGRSRAG